MILETSYIILLITFLYVLVKSSDYLVLYATILGQRLKISQFIIGITIVAIGTSLPELVSVVYGLLTSTQGGDFISGTIIGSNIANSLLIFGVLLLFTKKRINKISILDTLFLIFSTIIFILYLFFGLNVILAGIFGVFIFVLYMIITIYKATIIKIFQKNKKKSISNTPINLELEAELEEISQEGEKYKKTSSIIIFIYFIISVAFLNMSARGIVFSIDNLAILYNLPQFLLTFTTIALATSLPELSVTIQAARKNDIKLTLGNIIGSNISNILLIGGIGLTMSSLLNISIIVSTTTLVFLFISLIMLLLSIFIFSNTSFSKSLNLKYLKIGGGILILTYILIILYNIIAIVG